MAMWMALLGPLPKPAWFGNAARLVYIIAVRLAGTILANVMIFSGTVLYPIYRAGDAHWHISPMGDQIAAAGVMMVEESLLTIGLFCWLFLKVAREAEERQAILDAAAAQGSSSTSSGPRVPLPPGGATSCSSGSAPGARQRCPDGSRCSPAARAGDPAAPRPVAQGRGGAGAGPGPAPGARAGPGDRSPRSPDADGPPSMHTLPTEAAIRTVAERACGACAIGHGHPPSARMTSHAGPRRLRSSQPTADPVPAAHVRPTVRVRPRHAPAVPSGRRPPDRTRPPHGRPTSRSHPPDRPHPPPGDPRRPRASATPTTRTPPTPGSDSG